MLRCARKYRSDTVEVMTETTRARPVEVDALLTTLHDLPPESLTACVDWTVRNIAAHMAGNYDEVTRHVRAHAAGDPLTTTRGFAEREAAYLELRYDELLSVVEQGDATMRTEVCAVLDSEPDAELRWTGRQMKIASFLTHLRSECALHRWDMVGDDVVSMRMLGEYELLEHAVTAIGARPMTARGQADGSWTARIGATGQPDLSVSVEPAGVTLHLVPATDDPDITGDPAARLLTVWGRIPQPPSRLRAGDVGAAGRLRRLFAGY